MIGKNTKVFATLRVAIFSVFYNNGVVLLGFYLRVGIDIPKIEVRFQNLKIAAEAYAGSRALPTVFNYCVNMVEVND